MNENLQQAIEDDALFIYGADGDFSERIEYLRRGEKPPRRIYGVVERGESAVRSGMLHGRSTVTIVRVANHATRGIVPSELDTGDKLTFKVDGKNEETRVISTKDQNGQPLVTWDEQAVTITLI